ncbi:MAG: hypothetical protein PPP55_01260 [Halorubrum sp.]
MSRDGDADSDAADDSGDADGDARNVENERARSNDPGDAGSEENEWTFAVDDVGPDGVTEDSSTPRSEPIEPGSIELEHAVFVVAGVVLTVGVLLFGF